jgi:hypothetical protein
VKKRGIGVDIGTKVFRLFPLPKIDLPNSSELIIKIMTLVDQLLKLNDKKPELKLQTEINQRQTKIEYCENRINEIVYQLYGLTEEEIKIVKDKI